MVRSVRLIQNHVELQASQALSGVSVLNEGQILLLVRLLCVMVHVSLATPLHWQVALDRPCEADHRRDAALGQVVLLEDEEVLARFDCTQP